MAERSRKNGLKSAVQNDKSAPIFASVVPPEGESPHHFVKAAVKAPAFQAKRAVAESSGHVRYEKGNVGLGILFLVSGTLLFAFQDASTKVLVVHYPIGFIIMMRCWALALAGLLLLSAAPGTMKTTVKTKKPVLQFLRGLFVMSQWLLAAYSMRELGLGETTALYEAYPLFCTILAVFILHEKVGWRRMIGLIIGFCGILVMVRPGFGAVSVGTFCALGGALLFALYVVLTRFVSAYDTPQTSFFYMGAVSAVLMLPALPFVWTSVAFADIGLFILLGFFCVGAHFCMIKALSLTSVSILQPFNYSQLVWSILIGFIIFGDIPSKYTFIGAGLVVFSGLFVLFRGYTRRPRIIVRRRLGRNAVKTASSKIRS